MRILTLTLLLAACRGPTGGAAPSPTGTGTGAPAIAPIGTGTSGTTTSAPATWDGPLSDIPPTTTFVEGEVAQVYDVYFAVGDFDGNGIDDYALQTTIGVEVWFGPIPPGTLEIGTGPVHIVDDYGYVPRIHLAGDLDGDGRDELGLNESFVAVPSTGEVTVASIAVATVLPNLDQVALYDADGDGHTDIVSSGLGDWISLVYGPFTADPVVLPSWDSVPDARTALFRGPATGCPFGQDVEFYPDSDGNGTPEMLVTGDTFDDYDEEICGYEALHWIFGLGDLRGQILAPADALQSNLPGYDIMSDVDGDGTPELVESQALYRMSDVLTLGSAAAPFATNRDIEGLAWFSPFVDLNGDGLREVRGPRLLDATSVVGEIDQSRDGFALDPDIIPAGVGDFDGDGSDDVLTPRPDLHAIWAGSVLTERWLQAVTESSN